MSSSDSPPSKRRRTDSEDEPIPPAAAAIKRSEIWHEDGSVVLQAQDTQFRVHWGLLTMHSSVFKDMYGLPQPDVAGPTVEGCPVIPVFDDPTDLLHFFRVLYNPTMLTKETLPFATVAALVRIGRKYDFKELLQAAVSRLTHDYPSTLAEYDALVLSKKRRIGGYEGKTFDILNLAREHNIFSVLPLAYYTASSGLRHYRNMGLDGIIRADGTTSSLSPHDLQKCVMGVNALFRAQLKRGYTLSWVTISPEACSNLPGCMKERSKLLQTLLSVEHTRVLLFNSCESIKGWIESSLEHCCIACQTALLPQLAAGREKGWEDLPSFFDLPPWAELQNDL
ncbi:BTB domain-containing protein [Mycena chlorophos]|uniref:BTB domain-containing protein n=1 Tax=Mycena chlorophos TaxID=658473 RepID=A0A8H6SFV9_MYCCL|nr:BTB domain-containing protein [Mycena chlorophos]